MTVRVVCENHPELDASMTYLVGTIPDVGDRLGWDQIERGRHVDLCAECAAVLGREPSPAAADTEDDTPITDPQRRLIFARCHELGLDDDQRHALLERVTGDPSITNLASKDVDLVVRALDELETSRARA